MAINNQGVQILLNRMESHPEEFTNGPYGGMGRWDWVLDGVVARIENKHEPVADVGLHPSVRVPFPFLTNEEVDALYDKYMSIRGDAFTHRIMRELLEEEPEQSELEQRKLVISPAMLEQIREFAKR